MGLGDQLVTGLGDESPANSWLPSRRQNRKSVCQESRREHLTQRAVEHDTEAVMSTRGWRGESGSAHPSGAPPSLGPGLLAPTGHRLPAQGHSRRG